jgi:predicted site-specific integrase-resolvase
MDCLEPLLDPRKVARLLGVEVETLGAWRRKGYGPRWYRIGRKIKYSEADLRSWMSDQVLSLDCGTVGGQR